jgi:hypothetical protein
MKHWIIIGCGKRNFKDLEMKKQNYPKLHKEPSYSTQLALTLAGAAFGAVAALQ